MFFFILGGTIFFFFLPSPREWCGEGLQWAGCVLITILGQKQRFEALDFCYHLKKVYESVGGAELEVQGMVSVLYWVVET